MVTVQSELFFFCGVTDLLWLLQVERGGPTRTRFPDIYREFESLQAQVRQAAQDYIISPQVGVAPLEVRNIEVRGSAVFHRVLL